MKLRLIVFLCCLSALRLVSQDVLYTTSGNKYKVKVVEINTNEVKYKDFDNPEGPTYVITRMDVVLIQYQNGTSEIINSNPPGYTPNKTETYATKPKEINPNELYYVGKNFVSLNALALMNGDIAVFYDRELLNNKLGITAMGSYNINESAPAFNTLASNAYPNSKKVFDAGLGVNFFPSDKGRAQYFVGILFKYMEMRYDKSVYTEEEINGFVFQKNVITRSTSSQFFGGVTNGILVRVSHQFNFKLFATIGPASNTPAVTSYSSYPKIYLGYCFGYRF